MNIDQDFTTCKACKFLSIASIQLITISDHPPFHSSSHLPYANSNHSQISTLQELSKPCHAFKLCPSDFSTPLIFLL
jgi:hypothetical protein